jgi:amidase
VPPDARSPISITDPGSLFNHPLDREFKGVRIGWSRSLGGLPVDPRVTAVIEKQRHVFESLGCITEDFEPDFEGADEAFKVWRAWRVELGFAELLEGHRNVVKDTVIWNIEEGIKLSGPQIGAAERKRTDLYHRIRKLMETYEYLVLPVSQVPPFDVKERYVQEINGQVMETYIDWMKSCYYISAIGNPAISVPCGFTPDGLPIGIQIVGRHQNDFSVLQLAHAFEQETGFWKQKPSVVI